ncbi:UNVERIFIED_CONTAM: hypothetical protein HDU68_005352 [Siphonaria sp. JEL0065]|nr:hypothetical protein HDU68_005352 [Siphonaria sp. JEL0065]
MSPNTKEEQPNAAAIPEAINITSTTTSTETAKSTTTVSTVQTQISELQSQFSDALKRNNVETMSTILSMAIQLKKTVNDEENVDVKVSVDATLVEFHAIVASFAQKPSNEINVLELDTLPDEDEDEEDQAVKTAFDVLDILGAEDGGFGLDEEEEETDEKAGDQGNRVLDEMIQSMAAIRTRAADNVDLQKKNTDEWTRKQDQLKSMKQKLRENFGGGQDDRLSAQERLNRVHQLQNALFGGREDGSDEIPPTKLESFNDLLNSVSESADNGDLSWNDSVEAGKAFAMAHYSEELRDQEDEITRLRLELAELKQNQAAILQNASQSIPQTPANYEPDFTIAAESRNIREATGALKEIGIEIGEIQMEFGAALSSNDPEAINQIIKRCEDFKSSCASLFSKLTERIQNADFNDASANLMENIGLTLAAFQDITSSRNRSGLSLQEQDDIDNSDVIETQSAGSSGGDSAYDGINRPPNNNHRTTSHIMMNPADLFKTLSRADVAYGIASSSDESINDDEQQSSPTLQDLDKNSATLLLAQHESRIQEMSTALGLTTQGLTTETERQEQIMRDLLQLKKRSALEQSARQKQLEAFETQQKKLLSLKGQLGDLKNMSLVGVDGGNGTSEHQGVVAAERLLKLKQMQEAFKKLVGEEQEKNEGEEVEQEEGEIGVDEDDQLQEGSENPTSNAVEYAAKMAALAAYQSELQGQEDEISLLKSQLQELREAKALLDDKKKILAQVLQANGGGGFIEALEKETEEEEETDESRPSNTLRPNYLRLFEKLASAEAGIDGDEVEASRGASEPVQDEELAELEEKLDGIRRHQESLRSEASVRGGYGAKSSAGVGGVVKSGRSVQFSSAVEQINDAPMSLDNNERGVREGRDEVELSVEQLLAKLLENSVREKVQAHLESIPVKANEAASGSSASNPTSKKLKALNDTQLLVSAFEVQTGAALNSEEREYLWASLEQKDSHLNERMRNIWEGDMTGYEDIEVETFGDSCCSVGASCRHGYETSAGSNSVLPTAVQPEKRSGRYGCESETGSAELTPSEMSPQRQSQMDVDTEDNDFMNALDVDESQVEDAANKVEDGIEQILRHISDLKKTEVDFSKPDHIRAYTELFGSLSGQLEQFIEARKTIQQFKDVLEKQKLQTKSSQPTIAAVPISVGTNSNTATATTSAGTSDSFTFRQRPRPLQAERDLAKSFSNFKPVGLDTTSQPVAAVKKFSDDFDSIDTIMYSRNQQTNEEEEDAEGNDSNQDENGDDDVEQDFEEENEEEERTLDAKGVNRLTERTAFSADKPSNKRGSSTYSWVEAAKVDEVEVEDLKRANEIVEARLKAATAAEAMAQSTIRKIEQSASGGNNSSADASTLVLEGYSKKLYNQVKDSIYRGAANTISKYEHEPYFLVSTFKGLQKLDSSYLRQKFLLLLDSVLEERDKIQSETVESTATSTGYLAFSKSQGFGEDDAEEENDEDDDLYSAESSSVEGLSPRRAGYFSKKSEEGSPVRLSRRFRSYESSPAKSRSAESDADASYGTRIANCITTLVNESHPSSRFTGSQIQNLQNFLIGLVHAELNCITGPNENDPDLEELNVAAGLSEQAISVLMQDFDNLLQDRLNRYEGLHVHRVRRALVNESLDCVRDALQEARLAAESGWAKKVAAQEEANYLRRRVMKERMEAAENVLRESAQRRDRSAASGYGSSGEKASSKYTIDRRGSESPESRRFDAGVDARRYRYANDEEPLPVYPSSVLSNSVRQKQAVENLLKSVAAADGLYAAGQDRVEPIVIQREKYNSSARDDSVSPASTIKATSYNQPRQFGINKDRFEVAFGGGNGCGKGSSGKWGSLTKRSSASTLVERDF